MDEVARRQRGREKGAILGQLARELVHLPVDLDMAVGVELDVEPAALRLGEFGGGHDVELAPLEPGLVDAQLRAEAAQRLEPLLERQRLDLDGLVVRIDRPGVRPPAADSRPRR